MDGPPANGIARRQVQHEQINSVRPYHRRHGCSCGANRLHFYRGWAVSGKQYLTMADVIEGIQYDSLVEVIQRGLINDIEDAECAANAINSHDELVRQRDQLLASLKELLSSKTDTGLFAGVMAADNAAKLIKSIEDIKWAGGGHSPDAAPKLGGE